MGRKVRDLTTYEILLLLDPEHAEAREEEIVTRAREQVETSGGTWQSHDAWGRRRLAYPIARKEEGVYHLLVFDADGATLDEVSRVLKIDDAVLRHMATRHIAGSRTSAPREEFAAPALASSAPAEPAPVETAPVEVAPAPETPTEPADEADVSEPDESEPDVSADEEPEYAATDEEPETTAPAEEEE
jgi:small subunit ribosomal protein S6